MFSAFYPWKKTEKFCCDHLHTAKLCMESPHAEGIPKFPSAKNRCARAKRQQCMVVVCGAAEFGAGAKIRQPHCKHFQPAVWSMVFAPVQTVQTLSSCNKTKLKNQKEKFTQPRHKCAIFLTHTHTKKKKNSQLPFWVLAGKRGCTSVHEGWLVQSMKTKHWMKRKVNTWCYGKMVFPASEMCMSEAFSPLSSDKRCYVSMKPRQNFSQVNKTFLVPVLFLFGNDKTNGKMLTGIYFLNTILHTFQQTQIWLTRTHRMLTEYLSQDLCYNLHKTSSWFQWAGKIWTCLVGNGQLQARKWKGVDLTR